MVDQATIDATADLLRDQLGINDDDDGPMNGRLASRKKGKQAKKAQRREQANRGSESDDGDSEAEECSEQVNCARVGSRARDLCPHSNCAAGAPDC